VGGVSGDQLGAPTPCSGTPVAALLDHLMSLSSAFTAAAPKRPADANGGAGEPSADHLDPLWRKVLPRCLHELVEAWRDSHAWEGTTEPGGVTMPAVEMGVVVLDELLVHGWDLSRATGQPYRSDEASTAAVLASATAVQQGDEASREGLFGPAVPVADDARGSTEPWEWPVAIRPGRPRRADRHRRRAASRSPQPRPLRSNSIAPTG